MALILSIETSSQVCSVALAEDAKIIHCIELMDSNSHSTMLASSIQKCFTETKLDIKKLNAVAVSAGPGSYTGLRIGVSTAKGLCYGLDIPLIAIDTLQSLANSFLSNQLSDEKSILCPMIDARRMEVYMQFFDSSLRSLNALEAVIINESTFSEDLKTKKIIIFGNGAQKCIDTIKNDNLVFADEINLSAKGMVSLAYNKFLNSEFENLAYFEPNYLKEFIAGKSIVKGLI